MTTGESLECQCHGSGNSKGAGVRAVLYSFIHQMLLTLLGTGDMEMNMMHSFFARMELIF